MTAPTVPAVTDELIARLEAIVSADPEGAFPILSVVITALLAHIAALKQQLAAASVDAQMLAYARNVISQEWRPGSAGASAAKALLIHKLDVQLSCDARATAAD